MAKQRLEQLDLGGILTQSDELREFSESVSSRFEIGPNAIGEAEDGDYTDGFFPDFTSSTPMGHAIDKINELLLDIVPEKTDQLSTLTINGFNPSQYNGVLADGNPSISDWSPATVGSQLDFTTDTNVGFETGWFRSGEKDDFVPTNILSGGITASRRVGSGASSSIGQTGYSSYVGSPVGSIAIIASMSLYNGIWVRASSSIRYTQGIEQGYFRYKLKGDQNAGETSEYGYYYISSVYQNQHTLDNVSFFPIVPTTMSLSGVGYYTNGAQFQISITGSDVYQYLYQKYGIIGVSSSLTNAIGDLFTNIPIHQLTDPQYNDTLQKAGIFTINSNCATTYNNSGSLTVNLVKPRRTTQSSTVSFGKINGGISASTTTNESFFDEAYRVEDIDRTPWTSSNILSDGELQVQNGRLIPGEFGDYLTFTVKDNIYYRVYTPTQNNVSGSITIERNGFSGLSNIVGEWGSSAKLQIAYYIPSETGSYIYDFGRSAQSSPSGSIYGVRKGSPSGDVLQWSTNTYRPNAFITPTDPMILAVRVLSGSASDYLTKLDVDFALD